MFPREYCEIFKNTYFEEHLLTETENCQLKFVNLCFAIKKVQSKLVSYKKADKPHYKDYEWLQVTTSDYEPDYEWLQVTTNDYKHLRVKLRMTTSAIGNNLGHKNIYCFLWLHNNERSKYVKKCSKNSCVWWKLLKNTCMQKQLVACSHL